MCTHHIGMNVAINPLSTFLAKAIVEEIVSDPASHGMASHYDREITVLFVHSFHSFYSLCEISIPCFESQGCQSPAAIKGRSKRNVLGIKRVFLQISLRDWAQSDHSTSIRSQRCCKTYSYGAASRFSPRIYPISFSRNRVTSAQTTACGFEMASSTSHSHALS